MNSLALRGLRISRALLFTTFAISSNWIAGCTRVESVTWQSEGPLTYLQEASLQVVVKQGWFGKSDLDAYVEDSRNLAVVGKSHEILEPGKWRLTFKVVPISIGEDLDVTLRFGDERSRTRRIEFDSEMAVFSGRSNASFLEMTSAPDTSIYGSHITMWNGGGTQYVSGHAASNICRKVSAAVIDFATSHALINEDFFVGAGFASLPRDRDAAERLSKSLRALTHPKSLDPLLEMIELYGDARVAYDLADLLDDPASYRPRLPGAQHFAEVLASNDINGNAEELADWVRDPDQALSLIAGSSEFGDVIDDIKSMADGDREAFALSLRKLAALLGSDEILQREVENVKATSGLVRLRNGLSPDMKQIAADVRRWNVSVQAGDQAKLSEIASEAVGGGLEEERDLYQILASLRLEADEGDSAGPGGLVFLPFIHGVTGRDVEFELPKALFAPPSSDDSQQSLLEMLRSSVSREMVENLEDAARRQDESYEKTRDETLPRLRHDMAKAASSKVWLNTLVERTFTIVDARGKPTGQTETQLVSNFEFWADRLRYAEEVRRQASLYRQSAKRIQEGQHDPKVTEINEGALLDSFLRGWDLSFVDNSNESPYRSWMEARRNGVWLEIFKQAADQGIDLEPLVSEQTVFQVRSLGDKYTVRPMYVGDLGDTSAAKSEDGKLLYYRSPWMHREVVYLGKSDVPEPVWTTAESQFNPKSPEGAMQTLASSILEAALKESDEKRQSEGFRHAMVVDARYSVQRLTSDYWNMWKESDESLREQRQFEDILSQMDDEGRLPASAMEGMSEQEKDRLSFYAHTRAFEGGLKTMKCLAQTIGAVEDEQEPENASDDDSTSSREAAIAGQAHACFSVPSKSELAAIKVLELDKIVDEASSTLATSAANWRFDALGRSLAVGDMSAALNDIAEPLLRQSSEAIKWFPTKRAVAAHVRLEWYSGDYLTALTMMLNAVKKLSPSDAVFRREHLLAAMQMDLLKALVYSGVALGESDDAALSVASATRQPRVLAGSRTYFGLRKSDFAMRPTSVGRIAYRISLTGTDGRVASEVSGIVEDFRPLPQNISLTRDEAIGIPGELSGNTAAAGIHTTRIEAGIRKMVWARDEGGVHAASFIDVVDAEGHSRVAKFTAVDPVSANQSVDALRAKGFEMLSGKELKDDFNSTVVLAYPDHVVVLAGEEALKLAPPPGASSVVEAVSTAFKEAGVPLRRILEDSGLLQEASYIHARGIDPGRYFSSGSQFPGMVTYTRSGDGLRMLVRGDDGTLSSVILENGQLRKLSTGAAAVRDIEQAERSMLATASDGKVKFVHASTFEAKAGAKIRMQVGGASREVPVAEMQALLEGQRQSTPVLDELFAQRPGTERSTFVIYRDALVRGDPPGGTAGQPPLPPDGSPIPVLDRPRGGSPDADREFMVGAYGENLGHVPPIPMLVALKRRYQGFRFVLDDELDLARQNALDPVKINTVGDIGVYLPDRSFRVTSLGAVSGIRRNLEIAGIRVEPSFQALEERNVLVISGHKDKALEAYIEAHIKAGNLQGKQIVLFSCYAAGDADMVHRMIKEGGAKGVIYFSDEIRPEAVNATVKELAESVKGLQGKAPSGHEMIDLLDRSVEKAIRKSEVPEHTKKSLEVLRGGVQQISSLVHFHSDIAA